MVCTYFEVSKEFREHLELGARAEQISLSEYIRLTLARATDYDIVRERLAVVGRPSRVDSEANLERVTVRNTKSKERALRILESLKSELPKAELLQKLRDTGLSSSDTAVSGS